MRNIETMWDSLLELGVSEQTLQVVTNINGYNEKTMYDILCAATGYSRFADAYEDEFLDKFN